MGWIMGSRFLLLRHRGRHSGHTREVVLEVVRHDGGESTYYVASGWGMRASWYRNVTAEPRVEIEVGPRCMAAQAIALDNEAGRRELEDYGRRHPTAMRQLGRMMLGRRFEPSEVSYVELAELVPVVALKCEAS